MTLGVVVTIGTDPRAAEPTPPPTIAATTDDAPAATPAGTPAATATGTTATAKKEPSPWRGSEIAFRNSATAISFDKSAELSYNPTWVMALELSPRYSFSKMLSLSASLEFDREVTNSDDTTLRGETVLGDLSLRLAASKWATLPGGIDVSASLGFTFPTSLASQGDSLIMTVAPGLRLAKTFDQVLQGLTIGYSLRFTKLFHSYTTASLDSPVIPTCFANSAGSCDRFLNTGARNASYRLSNGIDVGLDITDWLSFSADFAIAVSWLYDSVDDDRVSHQELESTDSRYALIADLGFSARPFTPLEVRLGAGTVNPQLTPSGDRYAPFFNRYTALYLDLRLDVAGLVTELTQED